MAIFNSDYFLIRLSKEGLRTYLSDPANLKEILPADRIENWQSEGTSCSFKIKGLAEVSLNLETTALDEVIYISASPKPFPFKLVIQLEEGSESDTKINAYFDADVNSFMGAMLKTPLVNFLNALGVAIKKRYDEL
jgi:hypothetical protein